MHVRGDGSADTKKKKVKKFKKKKDFGNNVKPDRKRNRLVMKTKSSEPEQLDQRWKKIPLRKGKPLFDQPEIPSKILEKHSRGEGIEQDVIESFASKTFKKKTLIKEQKIQWAEESAARTELLLTENSGFLTASEGEVNKKLLQKQIAANVDITSATKYFELDLDFGPYRIDYTKNGRHLLIGGRRGHVGAFDWVTKKLHCEINVMEEIKDVQWLHIETMFAVAQKNWVYIYDNQGVELHCLQNLKKVMRMTFLPYHFLLVTSGEDSNISWLDVSIGEMVRTTNARKGKLGVMTHNPYNGIVCLGHQNGTVSMWSPNMKTPLVKMLCHKAAVETVSIDHTGMYMATSSVNRQLKIWDIRNFEGPIKNYELRCAPFDTSFSQRNGLALGFNNVVEVYKDWNIVNKKKPYLVHESLGTVENIEFCPYEDVLGIGTKTGFTSIIVPGAGEPNFDALEANPMQTKTQRREAEVKSLLDKIQPEMIVLNPNQLLEMNVPTMKDKLKAKVKLLHLDPPNVNFTPRNKKRSNSAKKARVKKIVKQDLKRVAAKQLAAAKEQILEEAGLGKSKQKKSISCGALDRFISKNRQKTSHHPGMSNRHKANPKEVE